MTASTALDEMMRLHFIIQRFHCDYAATLDCGDIDRWPDFFTADATYRLTSRENAESGDPLDLVSCDSPGMFRDRAYAIAHTEMFGPRYVKHYITNVQLLAVDLPRVQARANYLLLETMSEEPTRILQAGTYEDTFEIRNDRCLIKQRHCVFDTVVVPNCLVYPA